MLLDGTGHSNTSPYHYYYGTTSCSQAYLNNNCQLIVQGFNSYDGAITPGSNSPSEVADASAATVMLIEKAAAQLVDLMVQGGEAQRNQNNGTYGS